MFRRNSNKFRSGPPGSESENIGDTSIRVYDPVWLSRLSLVLPVLLGMAIFGQVVVFEFVWDDNNLIMANSWLDRMETLRLAFVRDFWALTNSPKPSGMYRPLVLLSYWLEVHLWGRQAVGFHSVNLGLHLINATMVWALIRRFGARPLVAAMATALFVAHPVQVEAVSNIASRTDLLATFFMLLATLLWLRKKKSWRLAAVAAMAMGLLCKESVIFGPVIMVTAAWSTHKKGEESFWYRFAPFGLWALYIPIRLYSVGIVPVGEGAGDGVGAWRGGALLVRYLVRLVWPSPQAPVVEFSPPSLWWALGSLLLVSFLFIAIWRRIPDRRVRLGLLWFTLGLLPASDVIPVGVRFSDLMLYLPMAGAALLVAGLLPNKPRTLFLAAGAAMALAIVTVPRVGYWKDDVSLWSFALKQDPGLPIAQMNLSNALRRRGEVTLGCRSLEHTLLLLSSRPNTEIASKTHYNLGNCRLEERRWTEAMNQYTEALTTAQNSHVRHNMTIALMELGRLKEAEEQAHFLVSANPGDASEWQLLGIVQARDKRFFSAIDSFSRAALLEPDQPRHRELLEKAKDALSKTPALPTVSE